MRLRILSDLHREFGQFKLPDVAADIVILAGDIDRGIRGVQWARQRFPNVPVLYVAGNHEHYGERIGRLHEKLREAADGSNVTVLENEVFELGGYRFFGATLWTDFNLLGDRVSAMQAAGSKEKGMNDYRKIRRRDAGKLAPKHTAMLHADSRAALDQFLTTGAWETSVVITHHGPAAQSVQAGRENELISASYVSNLEPLIAEKGPALWVHGHVHSTRDYQIGKTRVVNNALGYQTERLPEETGFVPGFVIDL